MSPSTGGPGDQPSNIPVIVRDLLAAEALHLELVAGEPGLDRGIVAVSVQKPGLALAGHLEAIHPERVQVIGFSEVSYLEGLDADRTRQRVEDLCNVGIPCILVTRGLAVPPDLVHCCRDAEIPLLRTHLSSASLIDELRLLLDSRLSPSTSMHGVLVDVFGVGVMILGHSGVGKSETALELVMRGHRLVADDIVEVRRRGIKSVYGSGPDIIKHHMEIRGLGIINIKDLFGISAVRDTKRIELVVKLEDWDEKEEYDRLGVDALTHEILHLPVPKIRLPVRPGRNISALIEVAARDQLLKFQGHHSARDFQERLIRAIARSSQAPLPPADVE